MFRRQQRFSDLLMQRYLGSFHTHESVMQTRHKCLSWQGIVPLREAPGLMNTSCFLYPAFQQMQLAATFKSIFAVCDAHVPQVTVATRSRPLQSISTSTARPAPHEAR